MARRRRGVGAAVGPRAAVPAAAPEVAAKAGECTRGGVPHGARRTRLTRKAPARQALHAAVRPDSSSEVARSPARRRCAAGACAPRALVPLLKSVSVHMCMHAC